MEKVKKLFNSFLVWLGVKENLRIFAATSLGISFGLTLGWLLNLSWWAGVVVIGFFIVTFASLIALAYYRMAFHRRKP